ncbi:hypothetical protein O6B72_07115 [Campylobacter ureolyticus]|uniref:hypothetical protein n=1 Tax=Campylobacter ureolyticus TaxID=827 RepID=UPI0022B3F1D3|nr:hypothetical protein [Campylobacter ureolyticus]MCZ6156578.1 hypothetical protein [Campylobacter ureolyticus]
MITDKELVCPHCGHKNNVDKFIKTLNLELCLIRFDNEIDWECEKCKQEFIVRIYLNIKYSIDYTIEDIKEKK